MESFYLHKLYEGLNLFSSNVRLLHLTFDDLAFCAEKMLDHWTVGSDEGSTGKSASRHSTVAQCIGV